MDNEKLLDRLADIENVLRIGFRLIYSVLKALYCQQNKDQRSANEHLLNAYEQWNLLEDE